MRVFRRDAIRSPNCQEGPFDPRCDTAALRQLALRDLALRDPSMIRWTGHHRIAAPREGPYGRATTRPPRRSSSVPRAACVGASGAFDRSRVGVLPFADCRNLLAVRPPGPAKADAACGPVMAWREDHSHGVSTFPPGEQG